MAVYTHVDANALARFLEDYRLGALVAQEGVAQGVENTNYIVTTTHGRYVLTLFEKRTNETDLPFFMAAMATIAGAGVPAPAPVPRRDGSVLGRLAGRPAVIVTFMEGAPRMAPTPADAAALGATLARMHEGGAGLALRRMNALSLDGWRALADRCRARADECAPGLAALVDDELSALARRWPKDLPSGLVHADLFPDNVFFSGEAVSGVIDFYFSCTDFFAYDLAITLNAWSSDAGSWRSDRADALLGAYRARRPLSSAEEAALPLLLRGAALRFLLTRLHDWLHRVEGAVVRVKDPLEYRDLLLGHRARDKG